MDIKPIKTEADYEAALEEIEWLMNAEPDTPEGDRLDVRISTNRALGIATSALSITTPSPMG